MKKLLLAIILIFSSLPAFSINDNNDMASMARYIIESTLTRIHAAEKNDRDRACNSSPETIKGETDTMMYVVAFERFKESRFEKLFLNMELSVPIQVLENFIGVNALNLPQILDAVCLEGTDEEVFSIINDIESILYN